MEDYLNVPAQCICRCGLEAQQIFNGLPVVDVNHYNSYMATRGDLEQAETERIILRVKGLQSLEHLAN